jgi:hypothetical protein
MTTKITDFYDLYYLANDEGCAEYFQSKFLKLIFKSHKNKYFFIKT